MRYIVECRLPNNTYWIRSSYLSSEFGEYDLAAMKLDIQTLNGRTKNPETTNPAGGVEYRIRRIN